MEQFRPKTPEELQEQINTVSETLDTSIVQESSSDENLELSLEEIKSKYPERYQVYLKLLRAKKNNQEIDQEELEDMKSWISALNNLDSYISHHNANHENLDFRSKKQLDVFEDIRDSLEEGKKEGYIKLPTGVGKTVLFSRVVEALDLKTLIVVPSKILVSQTGERLEQFTDVEFGKFFQNEKDLSKNVTVITYNSLIAGIKNGTIDELEYEALILDEAHKALGEETSKIIDRFKGVKLGFTATPKYSKRKHVSDLLEHEIHSMSTLEAVHDGLISRFKSYIAYTDTDLSGVKVKSGINYDEAQLERAINNKSRNLSAVELYKKQFDGQLAVAYCGGVDHATEMAKEFNDAGVVSEVISGNTPNDERDKILERFNSGQTKVLCNARVLIEGFDEPKASVCLNLHPTLSLIDAEQRAGRVLRLNPENPEKWAYVVDFIDKNCKVAPLTFAEIVEASEASEDYEVAVRTVSQDLYEDKKSDFENDSSRKDILDIEGLRVVVDAQEVLSISQDLGTNRSKEEIKFLNLDELKSAVRDNNIKSKTEYLAVQKEHLDWPSHPDQTYKNLGWVSWNDLLGKEKIKSLEELKRSVIDEGVETYDQYCVALKKHPEWPSSPDKFYKDLGWVSWPDLFGRTKIKLLSFDEFKEVIKEHNITSEDQYHALRRQNEGWPSSPRERYANSGWVSWGEIFGKEKIKFITLEELKRVLKDMNIKSVSMYLKERKKHPEWPSVPFEFYKNSGWVSWNDLFGKEKIKYLTLDELKSVLRNKKVKTTTEYRKLQKEHPEWPSNPPRAFKNSGWINWDDLLGK